MITKNSEAEVQDMDLNFKYLTDCSDRLAEKRDNFCTNKDHHLKAKNR